MDLTSPRHRWLAGQLPDPQRRRIVVLTGARQTGKTTLVRHLYPELPYFNLDDLELREQLRALPARHWSRTVADAILDEAQKEPSVFEKLKFAWDAGDVRFSALLGSSRILLLRRVTETLAGRTFLYELWPLMPSELRVPRGGPVELPLLDQLLDEAPGTVLKDEPPTLLGQQEQDRLDAIDHLARWGGMPELLRLDDDDRRRWLSSYQQSWMERDLVDLARLPDVAAFRRLQKLAMLRCGQLLNYAELARDAKVSAPTAKSYLGWLHVAFQVIELAPLPRNLTSEVVKSPKLYWTDLGLLRASTGQVGELTGPLFETLCVVEIHKWLRTRGRPEELRFYRTRSGLELDLMVGSPGGGWLGIECKLRDQAHASDLKAMRRVADALGDGWRGGLLLYRGRTIELLDEARDIWAMPVHRLF